MSIVHPPVQSPRVANFTMGLQAAKRGRGTDKQTNVWIYRFSLHSTRHHPLWGHRPKNLHLLAIIQKMKFSSRIWTQGTDLKHDSNFENGKEMLSWWNSDWVQPRAHSEGMRRIFRKSRKESQLNNRFNNKSERLFHHFWSENGREVVWTNDAH